MSLRSQFFGFDDSLARVGVPPLSSWWREGLGDWLDKYEREHTLECWACCGRGSAKSTALYKLALFFTMFGDFRIPPGERHYAIVLSRLRDEAAKGIAIISGWMGLLGVPFRPIGDVIELVDSPRGIRVVSASVAAASGWRAYFVGEDERGKWRASGTDDFDAEEVDTSASAMTATHRFAPFLAFGSAWTVGGRFYDVITAGETANRAVLGPAATWIAAPHLTEEDCRRKCEDVKAFDREYRSLFQGTALLLDPESAERLVRPLHPQSRSLAAGVQILDSSSGRGDAWAWCSCHYVSEPCVEQPHLTREVRDDQGTLIMRDALVYDVDTGAPQPNPNWHEPKARLYIHSVKGIEGRFADRVSFAEAVEETCTAARRVGVQSLYSDQYLEFAIASEARKHGLRHFSRAWTNASKCEAAATLRRLIKAGDVVIEDSDEGRKMRDELLALEERILPSGAVQIASRRSAAGHGDRAALVLMAALLESEGAIRGSPLARRGGGGPVVYDPYTDGCEHG